MPTAAAISNVFDFPVDAPPARPADTLADFDLTALAIRAVTRRDGTVTLFARGVDVEGQTHMLAMSTAAGNTARARVAFFAELLQRGLRSDRPILVSVDRCPALAARVRAAFGRRAIFLRA